jgi:hypothetical protein
VRYDLIKNRVSYNSRRAIPIGLQVEIRLQLRVDMNVLLASWHSMHAMNVIPHTGL